MDTITGISTPIGSGAISIVRLSGERAKSIALHFFSCLAFNKEQIQPNKMYLGEFKGEDFRERCMFVYFAAPRSYTGEDIVELHLHGGVKLTEKVLLELINDGARLAKAGEFSRKAFLNGKMTLAEAEGVLGLINAESEAELNASYRMMKGAIGKKLQPIVKKLLEAITVLTASLDYPDEMADEAEATLEPLLEIKKELEVFYATSKTGRLVKNGINVAIIGKPNVGKSSLLNAMLEKERAIVTDIAGTTRDILTESLIFDGIRINLLDTAGIRESADKIESIGVERAHLAAEEADVILYVIDITEGETAADYNLIEKYRDKRIIKVYNKSDLLEMQFENSENQLNVSAKEKVGIDSLLKTITDIAKNRRLYGDMLTEERHINAMKRAIERICSAIDSFGEITEDCILIDLNACYQALLEIDGGTATEEIIDNVFSRFCVGK